MASGCLNTVAIAGVIRWDYDGSERKV